jgi:hypothetical protein
VSQFLCWLSRITPDGVLTAIVLAVQLYLIWRTFRLSEEAERRSQRHDRVSVTPVLEYAVYRDANLFSITLHNFGLGPAKIIEQSFVIDGQPIRVGATPTPREALLRVLRSLTLSPNNLKHVGEFPPNTWLGTAGEIVCVRIALPNFGEAQLNALLPRIIFRTHYESIYGETFHADMV